MNHAAKDIEIYIIQNIIEINYVEKGADMNHYIMDIKVDTEDPTIHLPTTASWTRMIFAFIVRDVLVTMRF